MCVCVFFLISEYGHGLKLYHSTVLSMNVTFEPIISIINITDTLVFGKRDNVSIDSSVILQPNNTHLFTYYSAPRDVVPSADLFMGFSPSFNKANFIVSLHLSS